MALKKPLKFGQAASDYTPSDNTDEIWFKTFKDPATQIRICPAERENDKGVTVYGSAAWAMEREHFDQEIKAFPCAERLGIECVGCASDDDDVSQRSRKYYVNALDEKGDLRVFKFGVKLYTIFKGREQRALANDPANKQPLSDRDYVINRIKGNEGPRDVTYDPEPGDKYEVPWPDALHDIDQILADQYAKADAAFNGTPLPAREKVEPVLSKPKETKDSKGGWKTWGEAPTEEQIDEADTGDIKAWLDFREVEYPSRAPRPRLVAMAKKAAEPPF